MIQDYPISNTLCHYTSLENTISILNSGEIWLNSINHSNDPKEFTNWELNYTPEGSNLSTKDWDQISKDISERSKHASKISCFTKDFITDETNATARYCKQGCIDLGFANSPLWNFYADGHRGCCLVFDKNKLLKEFEAQTSGLLSSHGDVTYQNERFARDLFNEPYNFNAREYLNTSPKDDYIRNFLSERYKNIYFKKQAAWKYENEYRLFVAKFNSDVFKLKFNNSLMFIYFSSEHYQKNKSDLSSYTRQYNFSFKSLRFKNHTIQLENDCYLK